MLDRQTGSFAALSSRVTFQLDVANALATDYFAKLKPEHFLIGPRDGWSFHRGFWAGAYEGIRVVDRQRAPFALWQGTTFTDGVVEAKMLLPTSSEFAGVLLRAKAEGDDSRGYEIVLDPRAQRISLRRHAAELATLSEATVRIPIGKLFPIRIQIIGRQIRVSLHGEPLPVLDVLDPQPLDGAGQIGVRTWGGSVSFDNLVLTTLSGGDGKTFAVRSGAAEPKHRALQSFCLLVLNLNETIYAD